MRALAAWLVVVVACGQAPPAAVPATPRPPAPPPVDLSDPLSLLPAGSDAVFELDVATLRHGALWSKYERDVVGLVAPGFADCAYDPFADMTLVTAGIPMTPDDANDVIVVRGLDRARTLECLHTSKTETETVATFDGDFVTLANKSGNTSLMKFVDAKNAVMIGTKAPTEAGLNAALTAGAPLRHDAAFIELLGKLPAKFGIEFVLHPGSPLATKLEGRLGVHVSAFGIALDMGDELALHGVLTVDNAATAAGVVDRIRGQVARMKGVFARFDAHAEGPDVRIETAISAAQLASLLELAKAARGSADAH